uniref:Uncharacterized protein n=1 Tax=Anguilla anguilla TaxID=7936 RepID=A0A0E9RVD9_ANGAN
MNVSFRKLGYHSISENGWCKCGRKIT